MFLFHLDTFYVTHKTIKCVHVLYTRNVYNKEEKIENILSFLKYIYSIFIYEIPAFIH